MTSKVRVASVSLEQKDATSESGFLSSTRAHVRAARDADARLVVFPEYSFAGLSGRAHGSHWRCWSDDLEAHFKDLASEFDLHICAGSGPRRAQGMVTNTAVLFAPSGATVSQDKIHLTPIERAPWQMTAGTEVALVETPFAMVAILICYDVEFPELARACAAAGAEILIVPSWTDDVQGYYRVRLCAQARCIENQVFVVHAPLVGRIPSLPSFEQAYGRAGIFSPSDLCFPRGGVLAEGEWNQDLMVTADLDLDALRANRAEGSVTPLSDALAVRQPPTIRKASLT